MFQVEASTAGRYYCQPHNSLGQVAPASVELQVYQVPRVTAKPAPRIVKKTGDSNLQMSCSAVAKPKPKVRWFKDGVEIVAGAAGLASHYQVATSEQGQAVVSTLSFAGAGRGAAASLAHTDKGHYSCQFENQVGRAEHTTLLVIEHAPIPAHKHNKVTFDLGEQGTIGCRMQAYPEPSFDWTFDDDVLEPDRVNYYSNVTQLDQDLFESVLTVTRVRGSSYGEYTCRALNSVGAERTKILMQRKGPPEPPSALTVGEVGADFAMLEWRPGFDGGHADTYYVVEYSRAEAAPDTGVCHTGAGCNVTGLRHHSEYAVRVRARNSAGQSAWSPAVRLTTLVDLAHIPAPASLVFETSTSTAHVTAPATQLRLVAELELQTEDGGWVKHGDLALASSSYGQMEVSLAAPGRQLGYNQLPITDQGAAEAGAEAGEAVSGVRVRLCLEADRAACGPYTEARVVAELELGGEWLVAVVVVLTLLGLAALLVAVRCVCQARRNRDKAALPRPAHSAALDSYKAQMFAIAADHQHGTAAQLQDPGAGGSGASHTDSANSQEPLWAYQKSPSDYYPSAALEGYDNTAPYPVTSYPYIDETPTDPDRGLYLPPRGEDLGPRPHSRGPSRPISGQCE